MLRMESGELGDGLPAWACRVVARGVADALTACLRRAVDVHAVGVTAGDEFSESTEPHELAELEPTCRFAVPADHPRLAVCFSPSLAEALLDLLLGGDGQVCKPRGPLTVLDRQLLGPLVEQIAGLASPELPPRPMENGRNSPTGTVAAGGDARVTRMQSSWPHPQAGEDTASCVVALRVRLAEAALAMWLVWPCDAGTLAAALLPQAEDVELAAVIRESADRTALAGLADGDLLVSDVAPDGEILVTLGGIPRFAATLGQSNGKRAVTITRKL